MGEDGDAREVFEEAGAAAAGDAKVLSGCKECPLAAAPATPPSYEDAVVDVDDCCLLWPLTMERG